MYDTCMYHSISFIEENINTGPAGPGYTFFANSIDPDHLCSEEAN